MTQNSAISFLEVCSTVIYVSYSACSTQLSVGYRWWLVACIDFSRIHALSPLPDCSCLKDRALFLIFTIDQLQREQIPQLFKWWWSFITMTEYIKLMPPFYRCWGWLSWLSCPFGKILKKRHFQGQGDVLEIRQKVKLIKRIQKLGKRKPSEQKQPFSQALSLSLSHMAIHLWLLNINDVVSLFRNWHFLVPYVHD